MKSIIFVLSTLISLRAVALGLSGAYPEGGAQIELQRHQGADEISQGILLGYGLSNFWNPSVAVTQVQGAQGTSYLAGVGSAAVWSGSHLHAALLSGYSHVSGIGIVQFCGETAWNLTPDWTPYTRLAWEGPEVDQVSTEVSVGVRWSQSTTELLLERHFHESQTWLVGINWRLNGLVEFGVAGEFSEEPSVAFNVNLQP